MKTWDIIFRIDERVDNLENFHYFRIAQGLPDDDILKRVEFSLHREWHEELIIQGLDSETQGLTENFEFCERLDTSEEIFHMQGEGNHQNIKIKEFGERHQSAKSSQSKVSYQATKTLE